jgi:hypothetical protein
MTGILRKEIINLLGSGLKQERLLISEKEGK